VKNFIALFLMMVGVASAQINYSNYPLAGTLTGNELVLISVGSNPYTAKMYLTTTGDIAAIGGGSGGTPPFSALTSGTNDVATMLVGTGASLSPIASGIIIANGYIGVLPISNGGTNASTATGAITNLLPSQTGQSGNCLGTNGATVLWVACGGGGGGSAFSALTGGTNTSAAMLVGSGATLVPTGTGVIQASTLTAGITLSNGVVLSQPNEFNVLNYGAVCDGVTDDTLAINSTFQAALISTAYTTYQPVIVSGPIDSSHPSCAVGSSGTTYGINATGFNIWNTLGNGLSPGRLIIQHLHLHGSDPSNLGVIVLDVSGSLNNEYDDVQIYGDASHPPQIGFQQANTIGSSAAYGIHHVRNMTVGGYFKWTALYNMAGESTLYEDAVFSNGYISRGSLFSLGTITGGTGYDGGGSGTFTNIPLTGGSGAGATGSFTVASGVITKIVLNNWGKGYITSDTLGVGTVGAAGGSGFSVQPAAITTFGCVFDGQNHWNAQSHYATVSAAIDSQLSFTQVNFSRSSCRANMTSVFMVATSSMVFDRAYLNAENSTVAPAGIVLFDNGIASNVGPRFDLRVEANKTGGVPVFYISGTNSGPQILGGQFWLDYIKGGTGTGTSTPNVFNIDPALNVGNTGGVNLSAADIRLNYANKNPMLDNPASYSISGHIYSTTPYNINLPYQWSGELCIGGLLAPSRCDDKQLFGPADLIVPLGGTNLIASAGSCQHLLYTLIYQGPLCNIVRQSDNLSMDLWADSQGNVPISVFTSFCANTICNVAIVYDQSGHGNNAVQSTLASQPILTFDPVIPTKLSMQFVSGGAQALVQTSATGVDNIFTNTGGACGFVVSRTSTAAALSNLMYKSDGATVGWNLRLASGSKLELLQQASTSALDYVVTPAIPANLISIIDAEYTNPASTNVPQVRIQGSAVAFGTTTSYVGTVGSDAGQNLIIGNNVASSGTHAYPGGIFEWLCMSPTTALNSTQLPVWSRYAAWYYNVKTPVVH
jgi:hypothetical protein